MAGIAKPNAINLGKEAKYKILNFNGCRDSRGTGLFDTKCFNQWDTPNVMYWYNSNNFLEIEIISNKVNIWRCGSSSWTNSNKPLTIKKWNGTQYINITNLYKQNLSSISNNQWEKTIENLPKGKYKFIGGNGYRLDTEWYIENVIDYDLLLKYNNKYYCINFNFYQLPQKIIDSNGLILSCKKYGIKNINEIFKNISFKKVYVNINENNIYETIPIKINEIKNYIKSEKNFIEYGCNSYKIIDKIEDDFKFIIYKNN